MCTKCNYDVIIGNTGFTLIFQNANLNISDILCSLGLLHIYSLYVQYNLDL